MDDHPSDRLISAIRGGDLGKVKHLLDVYGMPRMKFGSRHNHYLCESLLNGKEDIARLLLQRGANVNELKNDFATPLHHAAKKGYTEVVSMLLEKDALVNAKDDDNETPLHLAVVGRNLETIELLLNKMADIEAKSKKGLTPLHLAVKLLGRAQTSEDDLDHTVASRCKLCIPKFKVTTDATDATKTVTSREDVVKFLLDRGANFDARNNDYQTVLQVAVQQCNLRIIERILLFRPVADGLVNDCLGIAVKSAGVNDRGVVELLADYGYTLRLKDAKNCGLLHNAVRNGYTEIVDDLLTLGADVEARHILANGGTLLHSAVANGRMRIAVLLIERGADINAQDSKGKTPIMHAAHNADPDMTELLLSNGVTDEGMPSPLHTAAARGRSDIMEMLLAKIPSIDVNAVGNVASTRLRFVNVQPRVSYRKKSNRVNTKESHDLTALHVAVAGGFLRVVEILLEHNANVDYFAKHVGTPLHCSVLQKNEAIAEMLLLHGAAVDAKREDGTTPLHIAVREGNAKAFELLIKHGADVHERNNKGLNVVHMAIEHGHLKMFEEDLLDVFKAGHSKANDGSTALHMAVDVGTLEDVEILLRHGADASAEGKNAETPLHYAVFRRASGGVLKALLNRLDDIDARDVNGKTALHKAMHVQNFAAVRLLLSHGCDVNIKNALGQTPLEIVKCDHFCDGFSQQKIAAYDKLAKIIEEQIVKMMALGLYVSANNRRLIYLSSVHKDIYDACEEEIESMKRTKIGECRVSFYEFLTTGNRQLAIYSKHRGIAAVLEVGDHTDTFKMYGDMIKWRFRKSKIVNDLMDSSARSLNALSGYCLEDYNYTEIFGYLDVRGLKNVIEAGASNEKSKK